MVARSENLDRTMVDTAASRESLGHTVRDDTAANCLMLLTRVGQCSGGGGQSRVFRCKTCMQEFSSFQALGGHRASHNNKPIHSSSSDEQSPSLSSGSFTKKKAKKTRLHRCPICGLDFSMGQALGGHMTKHRNKEDPGGALVTRSFFPEATTTTMFTTLKKPSSGKRAACLDLGSGSMEGMINLKLELGRTFS